MRCGRGDCGWRPTPTGRCRARGARCPATARWSRCCVPRWTGSRTWSSASPSRRCSPTAAALAKAQRPLVVGDRLDTDIEGAVGAGMDSLLVLTGVSDAPSCWPRPPQRRPTFVAADLSGLFAPGGGVGTSRRTDSGDWWDADGSVDRQLAAAGCLRTCVVGSRIGRRRGRHRGRRTDSESSRANGPAGVEEFAELQQVERVGLDGDLAGGDRPGDVELAAAPGRPGRRWTRSARSSPAGRRRRRCRPGGRR